MIKIKKHPLLACRKCGDGHYVYIFGMPENEKWCPTCLIKYRPDIIKEKYEKGKKTLPPESEDGKL